MSDTDTAILGVQSCGCITLVSMEAQPSRDTQRELTDIVRRGGEVRRMSLAEARALPDFFPSECLHDPKGWERKVPKEPNPIRYTRSLSRDVWVVYCRVSAWKTTGGFRGGEVAKRDGKWWATECWMDRAAASATDGHGDGKAATVYGPFPSRRTAAERLLPLATEKAEAFNGGLEEKRAQRAQALYARAVER